MYFHFEIMEEFYTEEYGYPEDIAGVITTPMNKLIDSDNFFREDDY